MGGLLLSAGAWFLGSAVARILIGGSLALVTYSGVSSVIQSLESNITASMSGMSGDMVQIFAMAGIGDAISIMVSTVGSVMAVSLASRVVGVKRT